MKVTLTEHLSFEPVIQAVRMSHDNHDKSDSCVWYKCGRCGNVDQNEFSHSGISEDVTCEKCDNSNITGIKITGQKDLELVERVGNKFKHKSVLEHLVYSFDIDGISRAVLQELARHRTASLTVKSTRYTMSKDLKKENSFLS